jgi:hypothetical protein
MGKEPGSRALVMASYSDEHYVDFWAPLVHDPARESAIGRLRALGLQQGADISGYAAGQRIIHKAKQQLHKIHKNDKALSPSVIGIVKEWKQAWHWWNVHTQPWKVAAEMVKPFGDDIECFTAGEAYSLEQGWVEGALKSAERALMAMSRITMARPDWIGDDEISRHGCLFGDYISH